jgi:hypothetical protein
VVSSHCNDFPRMSLLINNPVNSKLEEETGSQRQSQEGGTRTPKHSLVQHQQGSDQTCNGCALEDDGNQENSGGGGEIEQDEGQHEFPVHRNLRYETDQPVHDATK